MDKLNINGNVEGFKTLFVMRFIELEVTEQSVFQ